MKYVPIIAMICAMVFAMPLAAKEKAEPAVNASTKASFDEVSASVRENMTAGGRYSYVSAAERSMVNAKLNEMGSLYTKAPDIAQMTDAQKLQMFNDQEQVNAILTKHDNDRLICKNEIPVGSHIPVKSCETAGVVEARRRNDREYLQRRTQPGFHSGGG